MASKLRSVRSPLAGVAFATFAVLALAAPDALALPTLRTASDTVDDATITLTIMEKTLVPDAKSWCELDVDIRGTDVTFSTGDTVELWVYEDDTAGNDLIWNHKFTVSSAQVSANRVTQSFDCSADFSYDGPGGSLEIFAEAEVVKDDCGTFCAYDRPSTSTIDSAETDDDAFEEDDTQPSANTTGLGANNGFVGRDQDWFTFTTTSVTRMTFDALHLPSVGRLDVTLLDAAGSPVAVAVVTDLGDRTQLVAEPLPAGTWFVRVSPRFSSDPNFYDAVFAIDNLSTTCQPSASESRGCGNCGMETRTCDASGSWGGWSACMAEGECQPGGAESESCDPGDGSDGSRARSCLETCTWDAWTACMAEPCTDGESRPCYSGTVASRGVGACADGVETCIGGVFGACEGEVLPAIEVCDDLADDDCDGQPDASDDDCAAPTGSLGDVCASDDQCGEWVCIAPPDHQAFVNGYCGREQDCTGAPGECGPSGVCGAVGEGEYCLKRCTGADDCRADYVCADLGGGRGCMPRCRNNADCRDANTPLCDLLAGVCVREPGGPDVDDMSTGDTSGGDTSLPGTDTSASDTSTSGDTSVADDGDVTERVDPITAEAGCACASVRADTGRARRPVPWTLLGVLALVGGLVLRRRRG